MGEFTHFNQHGDAIMVDISEKTETAREAIAEGRIALVGDATACIGPDTAIS